MIFANNHVSREIAVFRDWIWLANIFLTEVLLHRGVQSQKVGFVFCEEMYAVINQAAFL